MDSEKLTRRKFVEISEELKESIERGDYAYGGVVPTVRQLAQDYGVSPQTISKSVSRLVDMGYLASRQGSGTTVVYKKAGQQGSSIAMMIDEGRSSFLKSLDMPDSYHSKDIYLAYMMIMTQEGLHPKFITYSRGSLEISEEEKNTLREFKGIIVQGTLPEVYFDFFAKEDISVVLINREVPIGVTGRFGQVLIDQTRNKEAFNYLGSLGHKKILFPIPDYLSDQYIVQHRYEEFNKAAAKAYGLKDYEIRKCLIDSESVECLENIKGLVKQGFTASVGFNDIASFSLYQVLNSIGVAIPQDFSVIGFDDIFMAQLSVPPLTTLRVPREEMVRKAYHLLHSLMQQSVPGGVLTDRVGVELIMRKSAAIKK